MESASFDCLNLLKDAVVFRQGLDILMHFSTRLDLVGMIDDLLLLLIG